MHYPITIVSLYCRNRSERDTLKGGIIDLSVVIHFGHILSRIWA